jgi:nicotinic acid mononucleotide adenylyltransferase
MKDEEKKDTEVVSKKKKKTDDVLVKNTIEINPKLEEAKGTTVVLGWGRMNPITIGHEKLVNKIKEVARQNNATPLVYLTHSQNPKKDPLQYRDKIRFAQKAFGKVVQKSNSKTIIQVMQELQSKFKDVILVVGSDRVNELGTLLNKYNGKDYTFDSIKTVSAGERDADADGVEGMSASKMREAASTAEDINATWVDSKGKKQPSFKSGLPKKLQSDAEAIWDMVRLGMQLAEELEAEELLEAGILNFQQRRKRSITMRKYKNKIAAARKRTMRKAASKSRLGKRSAKKAINMVRSKVAGKAGKSYRSLSSSQKMMIDKKVAKRKKLIGRIAKRLMPKVRRADRGRGGSGKIAEELNLMMQSPILEAVDNPKQPNTPTKRFHQARNKDGSIKLDGRFKIFKKKFEQNEEADWDAWFESDIGVTEDFDPRFEDFDPRFAEFADDKDLMDFIEASINDIYESIQLEEQKNESGLQAKADKSGISFNIISEVYQRGVDTWKEEFAEDVSPQQAGYARVNAFINGGKTRDDADADLWEQHQVESILKEETTMQGIKRILSKTTQKKKYAYAKDLVQKIVDRKRKEGNGKLRHSIGWYAATIADQVPGIDARILADMVEEHGAGDEGTKEVTNKYKKDTPGENISESIDDLFEAQFKVEVEGLPTMFVDAKSPGEVKANLRKKLKKPEDVQNIERVTPAQIKQHFRMVVKGEEDPTDVNEEFELFNEEVTQKQIKDLEVFADRLLAKFDVDVEFTRHFADRMNDERNNPSISIAELQRFFKKIAKNKGKDIKKNADTEAVLKDIQADLNLPVVIKYDRKKEEFEVVNKTIMRKKDFKTPNTVIKY